MEVLYDFSKFAAQVPIEYLFDLIPVIQPRAFSIASSFKVTCSESSENIVAFLRSRVKYLFQVNPQQLQVGTCSCC